MPKVKVTEWATIGNVVAPFGLQGELKVRLLTDIPDRFTTLEAVYLGPNHLTYTIEAVRPYKGEIIVLKLKGVDDATTAESLRKSDISIPLDKLAKLPPDSYYQHDIIGLNVSTVANRNLGKIAEIMVTGSNDVYIIKAPDGRQILIPAIKEVIKQVDLIRKIMYIEPIRGLLDDDETDLPEDEEVDLSVDTADK